MPVGRRMIYRGRWMLSHQFKISKLSFVLVLFWQFKCQKGAKWGDNGLSCRFGWTWCRSAVKQRIASTIYDISICYLCPEGRLCSRCALDVGYVVVWFLLMSLQKEMKLWPHKLNGCVDHGIKGGTFTNRKCNGDKHDMLAVTICRLSHEIHEVKWGEDHLQNIQRILTSAFPIYIVYYVAEKAITSFHHTVHHS